MQFSSWVECSTTAEQAIVPEVTPGIWNGTRRNSPGLAHTADGPIARVTPDGVGRLGLAVMVMAMVMVVSGGGECRPGEYQDQKNSSEDLFHALNVARS